MCITSITISPEQPAYSVPPFSKETAPPSGPSLETVIPLESSKHPTKSERLFPISFPANPVSNLTYQMIHVPTPAPSRSNGGVFGNARMLLLSSVIIHAPRLPVGEPVTFTSIGSGIPSTQILVSSVVVIIPLLISQISGTLLFSVQMVGLPVASQLPEELSIASYSMEDPVLKAGTKSPVVQIPAATATEALG